MAADFTSLLRLLLQETYSNPETWGEELNVGTIAMVDEAFGIAAIAVNDHVTLTTQNAISDQARRMALLLTGAGGFNVVAPALGKLYLVVNACAANVTLKTSVTAGVAIRAGTAVWTYFDGTNWQKVDPTLDRIAAPTANLSLNNRKITNLAEPTNPQDAATKNYIDVLASSGNLATVAAIAAQIVTVAGIDDEVVIVAAISAAIQIVANNLGSINNYYSLWLGASATPPTTRNDGSPLQAGDQYFNTDPDIMAVRVFNGSAWQASVTDVANLVSKLVYSTVTANTNAVDGAGYVCDTAGGGFTLTLPAAAPAGTRMGVICGDSVETNALTINPNGQTFYGATSNFTIGAPCSLVFTKIGTEWRVEP